MQLEIGEETGQTPETGTVMNEVKVIVVPGDTLSEIAVRHDLSVEELQRSNGIENPDLLHVGQTIVVYTPTNAPMSNPVGVWNVWMTAVVVLAFLVLLFLRKSRSRRRAHAAHYFLTGKAYVTDGDGIRVSGQEVRFAGLDAPEWNQPAKHRNGYWFAHGKRVKSALIREIGGKSVRVIVEDYDKFGRAVGTVTCNGRDIGEWLVSEGHAQALYSDRYKHIEAQAKRGSRGMWGHAVNIDPRNWRHRRRSKS